MKEVQDVGGNGGAYDCVVASACLSVLSNPASLSVGSACYPNCDFSTIPPILNVNDFICFNNRFAAGDSRANCDASTAIPTLNVNDFTCFINRYAAGCP